MNYIKLFEDFHSYGVDDIIDPKIIEDFFLDLTDIGFYVGLVGLNPGNFIAITIYKINNSLDELERFKFSDIKDSVKFMVDYLSDDFRIYQIKYNDGDKDIRIGNSFEDTDKIIDKDITQFQIELAKN